MLPGPLKPLRGPLVPVKAALEIKLIRFRVLRGAFCQPGLFFSRQPQSQLLRDFLRDIFLHGQDVGDRAIVLRAPELRAFLSVHKLRLDDQRVAALQQPAGENGADAELLAHFLRVGLFPLVAEHRAARHHAQVGQLREAIDDALADPITEVFGVGVSAHVDEGQHRQGIDHLAPPAQHGQPRGQRQQRCQRNSTRRHCRFASPPRLRQRRRA